MPRQPTWTHETVQHFKGEYRELLRANGIPENDIVVYADVLEIIQSLILFRRGGHNYTWIGGVPPNFDPLRVHVDIESLSDEKSRPYEVKASLTRIGDIENGVAYHASYENIEHECKEFQFPGKYRHRGDNCSNKRFWKDF